MKAALYCRLSEEDRGKLHREDESASIRNQKAMLISHAQNQGWDIFDIYSDDDYTGADRNRPDFKRLISDAKQRKFDIVLCKTQSRFTRELELVEAYIHDLFPRLGIRFVSIVDNADTADKGNKKSRQINGLVNEWFLEDLSDNIRTVLTHKRQHGQHIGSFAPYGYRKDPQYKGHLLIDPEAAVVVREIFRLFIQGHGKAAIARQLNEQQIPNPTEYKRQHGQFRSKKNPSNSTLWSYCTISDILSNEVYIGNLVQGKSGVVSCKTREKRLRPRNQWIIVTGTHEAIIEKTVWDRAQAQIAERSVPASNAQEGIFARKLRCAQCGYSLHSVKNGSKRGFTCRTHKMSAEKCPGTWISLPKLERIVVAALHTLSDELLDMDALAEGIETAPGLEEMRTQLTDELRLLQQKLSQNQTGLRELYMDKVQGIITEQDYLEFSAELTADIAQLQARIDGAGVQLREIESAVSSHLNKTVIGYTQSRTLLRQMVDALIDHILVGKRERKSGITPVEIHWKF